MTFDEMARIHATAFVMPRPWPAVEIADLLASPMCFVLTEAQGFLMGRVVAGEAELLTIAVDPATQRQGVGARLMQHFVAELRLRQTVRVFLEVAESNAAARALYVRAGFDVTGRRKGYYQGVDGKPVDAVVMARDIGAGTARTLTR